MNIRPEILRHRPERLKKFWKKAKDQVDAVGAVMPEPIVGLLPFALGRTSHGSTPAAAFNLHRVSLADVRPVKPLPYLSDKRTRINHFNGMPLPSGRQIFCDVISMAWLTDSTHYLMAARTEGDFIGYFSEPGRVEALDRKVRAYDPCDEARKCIIGERHFGRFLCRTFDTMKLAGIHEAPLIVNTHEHQLALRLTLKDGGRLMAVTAFDPDETAENHRRFTATNFGDVERKSISDLFPLIARYLQAGSRPCVIVSSLDLTIQSDELFQFLDLDFGCASACREAMFQAVAKGQSRDLGVLLNAMEDAGIQAREIFECLRAASVELGINAPFEALKLGHLDVTIQIMNFLRRHDAGAVAVELLGAQTVFDGTSGFWHAMQNDHAAVLDVVLDGLISLRISTGDVMKVLGVSRPDGHGGFMAAAIHGRRGALRSLLRHLPALGVVDDYALELLGATNPNGINGLVAACQMKRLDVVVDILDSMQSLGLVGRRAIRLLEAISNRGVSLFNSTLLPVESQDIFEAVLAALPGLGIDGVWALGLLYDAGPEIQRHPVEYQEARKTLLRALPALHLSPAQLTL